MSPEELKPGEVIKPVDDSNTLQVRGTNRNISPSYGIESVQSKPQIKHKRTRRFVLILILVSSILGLLIVAGMFVSRDNKAPAISSVTEEKSKPDVIAITAKRKEDFSNVCSGSVIANAVSISNTPRVISLFEETSTGSGEFADADYFVSDKSWVSDGSNYDKISLVGCMYHKSESYTGITCKVTTDSGNVIDMKLYSTDYQLKIYQAQSGKVLGSYTLQNPDKTCPLDAYYSKDSTKIFISPESSKLNQSIRPFIKTN